MFNGAQTDVSDNLVLDIMTWDSNVSCKLSWIEGVAIKNLTSIEIQTSEIDATFINISRASFMKQHFDLMWNDRSLSLSILTLSSFEGYVLSFFEFVGWHIWELAISDDEWSKYNGGVT